MSETSKPDSELTQLLRDAGSLRDTAQLIPVVFQELRSIAQHLLRKERLDHTFQPTALVNEVFLKLSADKGEQCIAWTDRAHFFATAAKIMRRLLLEHARHRGRRKRGGGRQRMPLTVVELAADEADAADIEGVNIAIERLEARDPRLAEVVKLRFFTGLTISEVAEFTNRSEATIQRDWQLARAWLGRELQQLSEV